MSDSEGDPSARSWVASTTSVLYRHLPYDSGQAILFLPASSGEGRGGRREERKEAGDSHSERAGITGEEARKFYEDVISRPRESDGIKRENSITANEKRSKRKREHHSVKQVLPPSKRLKDGGRSVLQTQLFKFAQEGDVDGLHSALSDGAHDINVRDIFHWTLLMCAAHAGHVTTVQYLLDNGAEWRGVVDKKGNTAVDLARISKHFHIAQLIVNSDKKAFGRTREGGREKRGRDWKSDERIEPRGHRNTFYCEVCKMDVSNSQPVSSQRHKTSVIHQFSCQHSPSMSPYIIPETNRGYQLLMRGGWSPGAGLGSQRQGQHFPVKTVLKQDRRGFGEPSGEKSRPRVTHFSAYDTDAIKSSRERSGVSDSGVVQRKKRDVLKAVEKERRWEVRMRRYMNTD